MRHRLLALLVIAITSCASPTTPEEQVWLSSTDSGFTYRYIAADEATVRDLMPTVKASADSDTSFLGLPYVLPLEVILYPNRVQFVNKMREVWNLPPTISPECGAAGTAGRHGIYLLSPRVWTAEAC